MEVFGGIEVEGDGEIPEFGEDIWRQLGYCKYDVPAQRSKSSIGTDLQRGKSQDRLSMPHMTVSF